MTGTLASRLCKHSLYRLRIAGNVDVPYPYRAGARCFVVCHERQALCPRSSGAPEPRSFTCYFVNGADGKAAPHLTPSNQRASLNTRAPLLTGISGCKDMGGWVRTQERTHHFTPASPQRLHQLQLLSGDHPQS